MAKAARLLNMSQPSVSQRILEMEARIGVPLFDRQVRPIALTSAGAILQQRAESIIVEISTIAPLLRQVGRVRMPSLRLGLVDSLTRALCPTICDFLRLRSERASIFTGHTTSHLSDLMTHRVDIIVGASALTELDRLERWMILEEPYIIACPKGTEPPTTLAQLATLASEMRLLRFSARSLTGSEIEAQLRRLRFDIPTGMEFDTCAAIATALLGGHGWAITTPLCVYEAGIDSESLDMHPFPGPRFARELTILARARELGNMPQELAELARKSIAKTFLPWTERHTPWARFRAAGSRT